MKQFFLALNTCEKTLLFIVLVIYGHNLFIDIMIVDAAQYASIALEMYATNSYLAIFDLGVDYLDKPPLLFWISSLFFKAFGVHTLTYKLGSFFMLLLAVYSTYKFTLLYYTQSIAKNAALLLATCQAFFLMTNDVRTDGLLLSSVITAIWLISNYFITKKINYLVLGAVFTGLAMLAKGPIGIIAVLMPIGVQLLYKKKAAEIISYNWIIYLVIVAVILLPMSYGLYMQFDLHPEKIIGGKLNQSGLYFYYWQQSFGRITGESFWDNGLPWHFFIGSIVWDYFPWIFLLYFGLFMQAKKLLQKQEVSELISLSGFLLLFIMLSMSKYKLPHYIFVTFPFAAILSANYMETISYNQAKNWIRFYRFLGILVLGILMAYSLFFFKEINGIVAFLGILQVYILFRSASSNTPFLPKILSLVIVLNLFLSFVFYPKLLTYQADSMAGKWISNSHPSAKTYVLDEPARAFNFYTKNPFLRVVKNPNLDTIQFPYWLYVQEKDLPRLEQNYVVTTKKGFPNYHITQIKLPFLVQESRPKCLEYKYLIQLVNKKPKR